MDLSIIIINWNVADLLSECLDSIYRSPVCIHGADGSRHGSGPDTEVVVVDSASTDNSVSMLRQRFPWVRLIACEENIGFVQGNNLGVEQASGDLILLLNPDTEVMDDALPRLVDVIRSDDTVGVAGPHTHNPDGSHQSTRRRFPDLLTAIFESPWLENIAPHRLIRRYRVEDRPDDGTYPVDWVQGSALMAQRSIWQEIGGLDERYIMYAEEMDWCKRATLAGWQVLYVGDAHIIHYGGQSSAQVKARSHVHYQHSKLRYFRKFHGWLPALILRVVLVSLYSSQVLLEGSKWLIGHKRSLRAERVGAYRVVLRSLVWAGEGAVSS